PALTERHWRNMEETVRLLEDPDTDVVLTFCDDCNGNLDPENSFVPPDGWCAALGIPAGSEVLRGVFRGPAPEALTQGWREEDFGHRCPVCVAEADRLAGDGDTAAMTDEGALALLTGKGV
ncbi:MAG: hypothetical protein ACREMO_06110, partial [Gemmatimonadales bacterium]